MLFDGDVAASVIAFSSREIAPLDIESLAEEAAAATAAVTTTTTATTATATFEHINDDDEIASWVKPASSSGDQTNWLFWRGGGGNKKFQRGGEKRP